jgi:hypothetical protein
MQPWLEANSTNISICFKPFTTAFRKQRDATIARGRFNKHNKIIFVGWVDKTLDESLIKQNIKVGFRV